MACITAPASVHLSRGTKVYKDLPSNCSAGVHACEPECLGRQGRFLRGVGIKRIPKRLHGGCMHGPVQGHCAAGATETDTHHKESEITENHRKHGSWSTFISFIFSVASGAQQPSTSKLVWCFGERRSQQRFMNKLQLQTGHNRKVDHDRA